MTTSETSRSRHHRSSRRGSSRRRRRDLWRVPLVGLVLLATGLIGYGGYRLWLAGMLPANEAADHWSEAKSEQKALVSLPRDDAPHDNYIEWWYYNGHLETKDGQRYAFHYAVFNVNEIASHTVAHVSLVDFKTGRHYTDQKRTTGNPSRGTQDGFDFTLGEWRMIGANGQDRIRATTADFSFNLELVEEAPPVMQGGTGLLNFALTGWSYYYSRPRMRATGALKVGDRVQEVTGLAWFDHQWGDFSTSVLGWDWFAIQLDDGTDVMLYQLFDSDHLPVLRSGTSARGGQTQVLGGDDFAVQVTDRWVSPHTGIDYPMGWQVELPNQAMRLRLAPVIRDSEFDGRTTTYKVYWEGPVQITGTHTGKGFVEMSGYGRPEKPPQSPPSKPAKPTR